MMERQLLILSLISLAGPISAQSREMQFAFYEFLTDRTDCQGPGHIAYRASFDVQLEEATNLRDSAGGPDGVCEITVRRGDTTVTTPIPCTNGEGRSMEPAEFVLTDGFCELTAELRPAETRFRGEFVGCISIAGHEFIGGDWEATTIRPDQTSVVSGTFDDDRLEVFYNASDGQSQNSSVPSLHVWLRLEDSILNDAQRTVVRSYGHLNYLWLIDSLQPGCREDPKACWLAMTPLDVAPLPETVKETARYCRINDDGTFDRTYTIRDVPIEEDK